MNSFALAIVIPCYNEYERISLKEFESFLANNPSVYICFVNDASKDATLSTLESIKSSFKNQVEIISNEVNLGKAESVRRGVLHCNSQSKSHTIAYLDADLATSLSECHSMLQFLGQGKDFVFASRILKIGSVVERKFSRFLFGRIIATVISNILDIKVYDTQCGCKVFKSDLAELLFKEKFISKWLFDVELFSRILCSRGKESALARMEEIPVKRWVDKGESKVKLSYAFRLWYDLYLIRKIHKRCLVDSKK